MCNTNSLFFSSNPSNKQSLNLCLRFPLAYQYTSVFGSSSGRTEERVLARNKKARGAQQVPNVRWGQWRSKYSQTNERKLANKLFTYIHAWSPFFPISSHSGVHVGRGKHPFCLHFGNTGVVWTLVYNQSQWQQRISSFCLFFVFIIFFFFTFLWHLFYFSSTKKIKQKGKIQIWGFPDMGFFFSERKPTLCLSSSDVRKCPKVWLHVSEEKKQNKKLGICMCVGVYVRAC